MGLLSSHGTAARQLQRVLLIGPAHKKAHPDFIENRRAEIQAHAGAALAKQDIVIKDDEWPGIIADLKALAGGDDKPFDTIADAIKHVLAQRGDPRGAGAADKEENEDVDLAPWLKFGEKGKKGSPEAAARNEPAFEYRHDKHGADKHFRGKKGLRTGAQWALSFAAADELMLQQVKDNLQTLLDHTNEGKTETFYFSADRGKKEVAGWVDTLDQPTSCYTMQIDVDRKKNWITYHGYPEINPTLGLGKTVAKGL